MGEKRKHAELIKAWADGAEIQWYHASAFKWLDIESPAWDQDVQYRIKPKDASEKLAEVRTVLLALRNTLMVADSSTSITKGDIVEGMLSALNMALDKTA